MANSENLSPLAIWEHNHQEATKMLADFAENGDVDWEAVLDSQQSMLDELLAAQDRRLTRRKRPQRRTR